MKKYLAFLTLGVAILSFNFKSIEGSSTGAVMSWNLTEIDLGQIELNKATTAEFVFQNTGSTALVIVSAQGSCGCTVADYSRGEILPGEFGEVTATYNAAKLGAFNKTITVNANTGNGPITLRIKGEVVN